MIKRAFDIAMAGMALILLTPLLVVVALLIKIESRGPALSDRSGWGKAEKPSLSTNFEQCVSIPLAGRFPRPVTPG